ncbi:related to cytochrome P450 monooxygenase [Lecanosticta acicola]|uniref:Related to cytochrome P450 monooxygenase n=1 Tax=Lecanosticta acicola TaxID=111012 RepID=A0AAI8YZD0_9PEZI|nr:related to cytochrome P450 monooxygenase [Lecanosticta acicola]
MPLPVIPLTAGCALIALALYKFIVHPAFLSPLSKVPSAHWTSRVSPLWIYYHRLQQNDTVAVHAAHQRLGPIIRLAPNELSVNSVEGGIRTIYAGGFEKGTWYSNYFSNYGVEPMFAMEGHSEHSKRKRMLSNVYAKSTLRASPALAKQTDIILDDRLYPRLKAAAESETPIEMYDVFAAVTMDFVSEYVFGMKNGTNFVQNVEEGTKLFRDFKARQKYTFWPQELPSFTSFMSRIGLKWLLVPEWVGKANNDLEAWLMRMCDNAEKTLRSIDNGDKENVEDYPTVYAQLRNSLLKDLSKSEQDLCVEDTVQSLRLEIASELIDHTLAGFDTSSITLTWLAWQLSRPENSHWQKNLHQELKSSVPSTHDAKALDSLPILHAISMETLRLHAAIPGNQPRITPPNTSLGDAEQGILYPNLPSNVRVQSQAWTLHRNPKIFPDPEKWDPSRWLPTPSKDMTRWFWAFGSGGRMCVGSNLAMLDMKATIAGVWGKFKTETVRDEGMVPNGGYMAEPLGVGPGGKKGIGKGREFLICRLTKL